ncbi:hypothetical protein STEG23_014053, partial [Scotinomys teguina]
MDLGKKMLITAKVEKGSPLEEELSSVRTLKCLNKEAEDNCKELCLGQQLSGQKVKHQLTVFSATPGLMVCGSIRKQVEQCEEQASKQRSSMVSVMVPSSGSRLQVLPSVIEWYGK